MAPPTTPEASSSASRGERRPPPAPLADSDSSLDCDGAIVAWRVFSCLSVGLWGCDRCVGSQFDPIRFDRVMSEIVRLSFFFRLPLAKRQASSSGDRSFASRALSESLNPDSIDPGK